LECFAAMPTKKTEIKKDSNKTKANGSKSSRSTSGSAKSGGVKSGSVKSGSAKSGSSGSMDSRLNKLETAAAARGDAAMPSVAVLARPSKKVAVGPEKLKHWAHIIKQNFMPEDWSAYAQSLATRIPLCHWRSVWPQCKRHPLSWTRTLDFKNTQPASKPRMLAWLKQLDAIAVDSPLKAKAATTLLDALQDWSADVEQRLSFAMEATADKSDCVEDLTCIACEAIAVVWLMPLAAVEGTQVVFDDLLSTLIRLTHATVDLKQSVLAATLLSVELPITLNLQFPELAVVNLLWAKSIDDWKVILDQVADGNGMPTHWFTNEFTAVMGSWTRCSKLARYMERSALEGDSEDHFNWAIGQVLRLMRKDGSQLLSKQQTSPEDGAMVDQMLQLAADNDDWQAAKLCCPALPVSSKSHKYDQIKEDRLADPADESEWSKVAILRSKWKNKSDKLAVDFGGRDVQIELENGRSWLGGALETEVLVDGKSVQLDSTWSQLCWFSDNEVVYLEIQNELEGGLGAIQRQFLVSRDYRFCFISDSVTLNDKASANQHKIEHHWKLPMAADVTFHPEKETNEGHLLSGKHRLNVLPITLPEWRVEFSRGSLATENSQVLTKYTVPASGLFQGLLIDLDHRRSRQPVTWRQLTVGENLEPVTIDKAVGFRVQLDRMQFLIYRSIAPIVGRTFMGQNHFCDFYLGHFNADGNCADLLKINAPDEGE